MIILSFVGSISAQDYFDSCFIHFNGENYREFKTGSIFNGNKILDNNFYSDKLFRNALKKNGTLLIAYKSDSEREKDIVSLSAGKSEIRITNKGILKDEEYYFKENYSDNGIIFSYEFGLKNCKKNNLLDLGLFTTDADTTDAVLEFLYFPMRLNFIERSILESYLSIKYGISLNNKSNYYNSRGDTIWNAEKNLDYNYNVTAISRDDSIHLIQENSINSELKGLLIGLGGSFFTDNYTSVVWGNNGKSLKFHKSDLNDLCINDRRWKIQNSSKSAQNLFLDFKIIKEQLFPNYKQENNDFIWMTYGDSANISYFDDQFILQEYLKDSSRIVFKGFHFSGDDNEKYFSFISAPRLFAATKPQLICDLNNLYNVELKFIGGTPPYMVNLSNQFLNVDIVSDTEFNSIQDLPDGDYTLCIHDSKGLVYSQQLILPKPIQQSVEIDMNWYLNEESCVKILPLINGPDDDLSFEWFKNGNTISTNKELVATEEGNYFLRCLDRTGCNSILPFTVSNINHEKNNILLYPNPVLSKSPIHLNILLTKPSRICIKVLDMDGKIIQDVDHANLDEYTMDFHLSTKGSYIFEISIDNIPYTKKVIVI